MHIFYAFLEKIPVCHRAILNTQYIMVLFRFVKNTGIKFQFDFKFKKKQQNIDNLIRITQVTL